MVFIDTHIAIWLYENLTDLLTADEKEAIEKEEISISPIILLEIEYLYDIGRIKKNTKSIIKYLSDKIGLEIDKNDFYKIVEISIKEKWTRDPFDRIIVSQAKLKDSYLITHDRKMKNNYSKVVK
jgi:PIN domain nuclease of toxin-antitoxin system